MTGLPNTTLTHVAGGLGCGRFHSLLHWNTAQYVLGLGYNQLQLLNKLLFLGFQHKVIFNLVIKENKNV